MALLDAPQYNAHRENVVKYSLIGAGVTVALLILLTLAGYLAGHGWLFSNLPTEHRVNTFFNALEAKDYSKAFGIYENDPDWTAHPQKHANYDLKEFTEDWTSESPVKKPIVEHHVDISRTDGTGTFGTGIIVAVRVNGENKIFMYVDRKDGSMTWPAPHEILY